MEIFKMKMFSRKLLVFVLATIGLVLSFINEQTWLIIAATYIGSQAVVDLVGDLGSRKKDVGGELPDTDDEQ